MSLATAEPAYPLHPAPHLDVRPATPLIGAEVGGVDLSRPLGQDTAEAIRQALLQWKVLFFRDQEITDEQFLAFGRAFGPLTPAHPIAKGLPSHPEIWERAAGEYKARHGRDPNAVSARPPRDYKGWHIDITFVANPNRYSILRGIQIPAYGGDTLWSNLEAVYNGLSPKIQALIDGLQAVHRTSSYDSGDERRSNDKTGQFAALHPVVRVHPETGTKTLFVNPGTTSHIVGLRERESQALLNLLADEVSRPEYTVRFRWTPHALVIWDNQATAHAGPIDYAHFDLPRIVRRITVAGDLPHGPDGFRSHPLEGELFSVIGQSRPGRAKAPFILLSRGSQTMRLLPAITLLSGLLLALSGAAGGGAAAETLAPDAAVPTEVPPGTRLVIGDLIGHNALVISGLIDKLPFKVEWANFSGGPLTIEAFRAKALDIGAVADIPPIHATWTGVPVKIVAATFRQDPIAHPVYGLGIAPGVAVKTLADLKGKKIAFSPGQAQGILVLRALEKAGLTQQDVDLVEMPSPVAGTYGTALGSKLVDVAPIGGAPLKH
jgi:taurine dioxygenase